MDAGGCRVLDEVMGASSTSDLGVTVKRMRLRETWGAWIPRKNAIVLADGLSDIDERCTLAHHMEHALAGHGPCGTGPHADRLRGARMLSSEAARQDDAADRGAARKLLAGVDLQPLALRRDLPAAARRLGVTEHLLTLRLAELFGDGPWPGTSKIAG
jgi:hypothetical protein